MSKLLKKWNLKVVMIIILVFQLFHLVYWDIQKEGYYLDEIWSYGLANGYYEPFFQEQNDYMNVEHSADYYTRWITTGEHSFQYDSVYYNQTKDVHPPLFYYALHTICSMFPNTFSKWFGLTINLIFFALTQFILYSISAELFGGGKLAV